MNLPPMAESLPPLHRLALTYAPRATRSMWEGFLLLDARLAGILSSKREPMLAQIRLAWWRERFAEAPSAWPRGEPLMALLSGWESVLPALSCLVDGWEALLAEPSLPPDGIQDFASGRAEACAAIARLGGATAAVDDAMHMARGWALADLASHLSNPAERDAVQKFSSAYAPAVPLPRVLRPLAVLHGTAFRQMTGAGPGAVLTAIRLGLLGR